MDRKFWRGVFVGLWAAVLLLFLQAWTFGGHPSTCYVGWGNGSGAKIAETANYDYVLTAAHCVFDNARGQWIKEIEVRYPNYDRPVVAKTLDVNQGLDVAILQHEKTGIPYKPLAIPSAGETVWADGLRSGKRQTRVIGVPDESGVLQLQHSRIIKPFVMLDGKARGGDSGGPIRNSQDEVVAVLHSGDGRVTFCTGAREIARRLPQRLMQAICPGNICASSGVRYPTPGVPYPTPEPPRIEYPEPPSPEREPMPGPEGPAGPQGPAGPDGPAGKDADERRIIEAVIAALEPKLQPHDPEELARRIQPFLDPLLFEVKQLDAQEYAKWKQEGGGGDKGPIAKRLGETLTIAHYRFDIDDIAKEVADKLKQ